MPESSASLLHRSSFVFDAHCDTLGAATLPPHRRRDLTQWGDSGHLDLPRMQAGGINAQIFACFPGVERLNACPTRGSMLRIEALYALIRQQPDSLTLVKTAAEMARLTPDGPVGAILGLEGVEALAGDLSLLYAFHRLGVRNIGLTWCHRNAAADGVSTHSDYGLTAFGRELVQHCNELGIMLDASHLNRAGLDELLALSDKPIIASHSNARALFEHRRNLDDAQLRAIAQNGGVIGVTFVTYFLREPQEKATLEDVLNHIEHVATVAGVEHVGLGSDYDGATMPPELDSGEKYPALTAGLLRRGFSEADTRKILGENLRRVFMDVLPPA